MKRMFKTILVVGVCAAGVLVTAHLVLGKERTRSAARALQDMARAEVDDLIRQQTDLRAELGRVREAYPQQVATLRHQLNEIDRRLTEIEKELQRAGDIVRLCEEDVSFLEVQRDNAGDVHANAMVIEHRGSRYSLAEAERMLARIETTRRIYDTRRGDLTAEADGLRVERGQLEIELDAVQTEQAEFEIEYQSLLREIERLSRNEEVLKHAEKRRGRQGNRHEQAMGTIQQVKSAIERARLEQEERLKAARVAPRDLDYESRARALEATRRQAAKGSKDETNLRLERR